MMELKYIFTGDKILSGLFVFYFKSRNKYILYKLCQTNMVPIVFQFSWCITNQPQSSSCLCIMFPGVLRSLTIVVTEADYSWFEQHETQFFREETDRCTSRGWQICIFLWSSRYRRCFLYTQLNRYTLILGH